MRKLVIEVEDDQVQMDEGGSVKILGLATLVSEIKPSPPEKPAIPKATNATPAPGFNPQGPAPVKHMVTCPSCGKGPFPVTFDKGTLTLGCGHTVEMNQ
jgi:hypothetical protein